MGKQGKREDLVTSVCFLGCPEKINVLFLCRDSNAGRRDRRRLKKTSKLNLVKFKRRVEASRSPKQFGSDFGQLRFRSKFSVF